jgi:hypothetical protein
MFLNLPLLRGGRLTFGRKVQPARESNWLDILPTSDFTQRYIEYLGCTRRDVEEWREKNLFLARICFTSWEPRSKLSTSLGRLLHASGREEFQACKNKVRTFSTTSKFELKDVNRDALTNHRTGNGIVTID